MRSRPMGQQQGLYGRESGMCRVGRLWDDDPAENEFRSCGIEPHAAHQRRPRCFFVDFDGHHREWREGSPGGTASLEREIYS